MVLAEAEDLPRWDAPEELAVLYGGAIGLDEPCLVANFVESLDGVVAVPGLQRSHAVIGDESEADRFLLALVRACADAVVVGSGTLLASPQGTWRIDRAYPPAAEALAELRTGLSAGYLNHLVHGNRPVPSNDVVATLAEALEVEPEHFREYRLRVITDRLEAMPALIDRLYRQLNKSS